METSETKNGKSKTIYIYIYIYIYFHLKFVKMKKIFYHFNPETTELRRTYLRIIQIFEKIIDKDRFT